MSGGGREPDVARFALQATSPSEPVLGRLVKRGLDDELKGTAYAIIDGVDGRTHHLALFPISEMTGDAKPGAIVEAASLRRRRTAARRLSLATRSDLRSKRRFDCIGATWLDRQLLAKDRPLSGGGFGAELRQAMDRRVDHLVEEDLARGTGGGSSSLAICSIPCAGANWTRRSPSSRPKPACASPVR